MRLGIVGLDGQDPSNQVDRDILAAHLAGKHPEEMEAIGVVGISGTDLPVKAFGLGEPAGLVMRERRRPVAKSRIRTEPTF